MRQRRGSGYLLTGLIVGLALGVAYSWLVSPVRLVDNPPSALRDDFKDQYRALIAVAFTASRDLGRATARLALLGDPDPSRALAAQAQRTLAQGGGANEARALGDLAAALRQAETSVVSGPATATPPSPLTGTPSPAVGLASSSTLTGTLEASSTPQRTATSTSSPSPSATLRPTLTPTATPGLPFELQDSEQICDPDLPEPLIQVLVSDADGVPVPGVEILVQWEAGQESFFTGLKPELGLGYADFTMDPGQTYTVQLVAGGDPVPDLSAPQCRQAGGSTYWGSWLLTFSQPQ